MKPNERHWEIMFQYFEKCPEMATGRMNAENGKYKMKTLWDEMSATLNSLGYGCKSSDKWHKTWVDYKSNLKRKAADIKKEQNKTGGGLPKCKILNEYEMRALQLLGPGFAEGVKNREIGLKVCSRSGSPTEVNTSYRNRKESVSPSLLKMPFSCQTVVSGYTTENDIQTNTISETVTGTPAGILMDNYACSSIPLKKAVTRNVSLIDKNYPCSSTMEHTTQKRKEAMVGLEHNYADKKKEKSKDG